MKAVDSDSLLCDFYQFYHVDPDELPLMKAAILACGLPTESRIMMKLRNQKVSDKQMLTMAIIDILNDFKYAYAKRNFKGHIQKPESMIRKLNEEDDGIRRFDTAEEFEEARRKIIG